MIACDFLANLNHVSRDGGLKHCDYHIGDPLPRPEEVGDKDSFAFALMTIMHANVNHSMQPDFNRITELVHQAKHI